MIVSFWFCRLNMTWAGQMTGAWSHDWSRWHDRAQPHDWSRSHDRNMITWLKRVTWPEHNHMTEAGHMTIAWWLITWLKQVTWSKSGQRTINVNYASCNIFQFHLCHQGALFNFDFTFFIYGQVVKTTPVRFLICCVLTKFGLMYGTYP